VASIDRRGYRTARRGYRTARRGYRTARRGYRTARHGYQPRPWAIEQGAARADLVCIKVILGKLLADGALFLGFFALHLPFAHAISPPMHTAVTDPPALEHLCTFDDSAGIPNKTRCNT
jgi:hypothetical protein